MKRQRRGLGFLRELKKAVHDLKDMKDGQVHIINVHANYGRYQIAIGAKGHPVEIDGQIHHIFVSPHSVRAQPSKKQMLDNMKDTVIMRELSIHLRDPNGDGHHLEHPPEVDEVSAKEYINLAGQEGEKIIKESKHSKSLSMAAYKIVQEDIIKSLKEHKEESLD